MGLEGLELGEGDHSERNCGIGKSEGAIGLSPSIAPSDRVVSQVIVVQPLPRQNPYSLEFMQLGRLGCFEPTRSSAQCVDGRERFRHARTVGLVCSMRPM